SRQSRGFLAVHWRKRHAEKKGRAFPRLAGQTDRAAERFDNALGDGKTESRAAIAARRRTVGLLEILEDAHLIRGGNADAGIADRKTDALVIVRLRKQWTDATGGELDCIRP